MTHQDLHRAIDRAARAAQGDSNDEEIDALWDALDKACTQLGVDLDAARERAGS